MLDFREYRPPVRLFPKAHDRKQDRLFEHAEHFGGYNYNVVNKSRSTDPLLGRCDIGD